MKEDIQHIISACQKNDRKAQRTLFELYNKKLFGIAMNYMHDIEEAKEVCQESWIQVFNSLGKYEEHGQFNAWVKKIVIRVCWKAIRKEKNMVSLNSFTDTVAISEVSKIYDKFECEELLSLLEILPTNSKAVFIMYVIDGLSHNEIAEAMDIKETTSRAHLFKARQLLKEKYFSLNKIAGNGL